jgi:predicted PhzF superfamily epimerase YddE/YHI9
MTASIKMADQWEFRQATVFHSRSAMGNPTGVDVAPEALPQQALSIAVLLGIPAVVFLSPTWSPGRWTLYGFSRSESLALCTQAPPKSLVVLRAPHGEGARTVRRFGAGDRDCALLGLPASRRGAP